MKTKEKLKTLKDLESHSFDTGSNEWVSMVELKAEAVKWVKFMSKQENWEDMVYEKNWEKLFKHFFNLTKKDLT